MSYLTQDTPQKNIVMTGATSGFGAKALEKLTVVPNVHIFVGARETVTDVTKGVDFLPLDLISLESVREFAEAVSQKLGKSEIDVLVLNAGIRGSDAEQLSKDGYGRTFAVNHLAHYLLARLLLPKMANNGRLIITSSDMHDPPIKRLAPKSIEIQEWAYPTKGGSGTGIRSYIASKLCNLMTGLSFSKLEDVKKREIDVVVFNPGLTGGSGTGKETPLLQRLVVKIMMRTIFPLIGLFRSEFIMNTAEHSGRMLADITLGILSPPPEKIYLSLVKGRPTFPAPSELAQNEEGQRLLWEKSEEMVGLD